MIFDEMFSYYFCLLNNCIMKCLGNALRSRSKVVVMKLFVICNLNVFRHFSFILHWQGYNVKFLSLLYTLMLLSSAERRKGYFVYIAAN